MSDCAPRPGASIPLPVLAPGHGRRAATFGTRRGWTRTLVLSGVWLFMAAHLVQWLAMGSTLAPIEPSESMATSKEGIITVGTIFFVVAIASTALLGRWFCGWGCHWVGLQDGTAWLLAKWGIRPKPFRSRLLVWVPLLLAFYMFLWPVFYRLAIAPWTQPDLRWPGWSTHLITDDFWATFPGIAMAIPFTLVSGILVVYLLGSKGYCTYACPYGGFFAPAEELAPMRIVVDADRCHQCGVCTAVCTSNVRVHEEVRDYGMVVDPGCMKCMDCVTACPNEALRFGLGKPAISVDRSGTRAAASAAQRYDLTWPEEIALGVLALLVFLSVRGIYLGVPLLFASGIAACTVFLAWKSWRILRSPNVGFHRWQLRFHGALRPAGAAWLAATAATLAGIGYFGVLNGFVWQADRLDARITLPAEAIFAENAATLPASQAAAAREALAWYARASLAPEGISLVPAAQQQIDLRRAYLLAALRDFDGAEAMLRRSWERDGPALAVAAGIGRLRRALPSRQREAIAWYDEVLAAHPDWQTLREEQITWLDEQGEFERAIRSARDGLQAMPEGTSDPKRRLLAMRRLSLMLAERGETPQELAEGIDLIRQTLVIEPDNAFAHAALGRALLRVGRNAEALQAFDRAVELDPSSPALKGMREEAQQYKE